MSRCHGEKVPYIIQPARQEWPPTNQHTLTNCLGIYFGPVFRALTIWDQILPDSFIQKVTNITSCVFLLSVSSSEAGRGSQQWFSEMFVSFKRLISDYLIFSSGLFYTKNMNKTMLQNTYWGICFGQPFFSSIFTNNSLTPYFKNKFSDSFFLRS